MNIFFIAGSSSQAIEETLAATKSEKKKAFIRKNTNKHCFCGLTKRININ